MEFEYESFQEAWAAGNVVLRVHRVNYSIFTRIKNNHAFTTG